MSTANTNSINTRGIRRNLTNTLPEIIQIPIIWKTHTRNTCKTALKPHTILPVKTTNLHDTILVEIVPHKSPPLCTPAHKVRTWQRNRFKKQTGEIPVQDRNPRLKSHLKPKPTMLPAEIETAQVSILKPQSTRLPRRGNTTTNVFSACFLTLP